MVGTIGGASAQRRDESHNSKLTPEAIQEIAKKLRIAPDGRHMRSVIAAQYGGMDKFERDAATRDDEEGLTRPVVLHLRSTKGVPLPAPEDLPPILRIGPEEQQKIVEKYLEGLEQVSTMHQKVPDLPRCAESKTTREDTGMKNAGGDKTILFDMLFLPRDKVPLDPDEVFGKKTVVQPYDASVPNGISFGAIGVGVTCLPTRMRATKAYVYRDEGANALKNFDAGPHGKGKIHPKMKEYVDSFERP
jgi:hypothetical protein